MSPIQAEGVLAKPHNLGGSTGWEGISVVLCTTITVLSGVLEGASCERISERPCSCSYYWLVRVNTVNMPFSRSISVYYVHCLFVVFPSVQGDYTRIRLIFGPHLPNKIGCDKHEVT